MSDLTANLRAIAQESLDRWGVPGAAIGLLHDGEITLAGFGITSVETRQPVTPETLFRIASISKPFTATLAMTLVNDGLLDLDRPIADYLPGVALTDGPAEWQQAITMRHLLSHTAGIDCELGIDLMSAGMGDDALGMAIGHYATLHQWGEPGPIMSYGNTGFWLAGHTIATILGQSFEDAMRERVFIPLGLERSVYTAEEAIVYPVALGHQPLALDAPEHELIRSFAYPRARRPSGGVISTVVDLLRFSQWHLGHAEAPEMHLSPALRDAMRDPVVHLRDAPEGTSVKDTSVESWGIGWNLDPAKDGTLTIGHGGSIGGYQSHLTLVPDRGFALAILTNSARGGMACAEIGEAFLAELLGLDLSVPDAISLPDDALAAFAGTYRQPEGEFTFTVANAGLTMAFGGAYGPVPGEVPPPVPMVPVGARSFIVPDGPFVGSRADFLLDAETGTFTKARIGVRVAHRIADA